MDLFNISPPKNHILPIFSIDLDYSQAEVAASLRATARERGNPMTFFIKKMSLRMTSL